MHLKTLLLSLGAMSVMWWQHDDIKVGVIPIVMHQEGLKRVKMNVSKVKKKF